MSTGLLQRLEVEVSDLRAEGDAIATLAEASGGFSDEQRTRRDEIVARMSQLNGDIEAERSRQSWQRTAPAEPVADPVPAIPSDKAPTPFATLGEQLHAIYRAGSNPQIAPDPRLVAINEYAARQAAAAGAGESIGADGGFLVQSDLAATITQRVYNEGVLANACTFIDVGAGFNGVKVPLLNETSRADGSRFGAVRAYWLDEGTAITASRPKYAQTLIELKRLAGLFYATDDLLQDSVAVNSITDAAFTAELAFALDDSIINGTGSGRPQGILNANATVSVAKETGQAASTVLSENIWKMYARLWAPSMGRAKWFINQDVLPQIFQLKQDVGTGGVPMYMPPGGISAAPHGTLMGRDIVPIEHAATLGTVGDIMLADLSQYLLARKGGELAFGRGPPTPTPCFQFAGVALYACELPRSQRLHEMLLQHEPGR